jgi:hypothetical protein
MDVSDNTNFVRWFLCFNPREQQISPGALPLRRVVLALALIVIAGLGAFLWSSRSLGPKSVEVAPKGEANDQQIQPAPAVAAVSETAQVKMINADPKALMGLPVHHGSYVYRGIEVGDSQAKVMAKLKEFGYLTWENNGLDRYTAKENQRQVSLE